MGHQFTYCGRCWKAIASERHSGEPVSITGVRTMFFEPADTYMQRSKVDRQKHIDLCVECIEIGGGSKDFRGLLAHFLSTHIMTRKDGANLCHACHNDKCSNPKHLYWGTYAENSADHHIRIGSTNKRKNRARAGSPEHREKISLSIKRKQDSDPEFLRLQRARMANAQRFRRHNNHAQ